MTDQLLHILFFDTTLHVREGHTLVTHGPYGWVRHPMYTALFLFGAGTFILAANWLVGLPLIVGVSLVVLSRVKHEEAVLADQFGDEYRAHARRAGRFLPPVRRSTI